MLLGLGLIFPQFERLLEKPFARLPQRRVNKEGSAFALGLGLGLLYVPCAGPVLAAITVAGATDKIGMRRAHPVLRRGHRDSLAGLRPRRTRRRPPSAPSAARHVPHRRRRGDDPLACALAFNLTDALQRALPDYTAAAQNAWRTTASPQKLPAALQQLEQATNEVRRRRGPTRECGPAPPSPASQMAQHPGGKPVSIKSLRGQSRADRLLDLLLHQLPALACRTSRRGTAPTMTPDSRSSASTARSSPSREGGQRRRQARKLGVDYPVALDKHTTWDNYRNRFWPAEYLIDATGHVRYFSFGEGGYADDRVAHPAAAARRPPERESASAPDRRARHHPRQPQPVTGDLPRRRARAVLRRQLLHDRHVRVPVRPRRRTPSPSPAPGPSASSRSPRARTPRSSCLTTPPTSTSTSAAPAPSPSPPAARRRSSSVSGAPDIYTVASQPTRRERHRDDQGVTGPAGLLIHLRLIGRCDGPRGTGAAGAPRSGRGCRCAAIGMISRTSAEPPGMASCGLPVRMVSISSAEPASRIE